MTTGVWSDGFSNLRGALSIHALLRVERTGSVTQMNANVRSLPFMKERMVIMSRDMAIMNGNVKSMDQDVAAMDQNVAVITAGGDLPALAARRR
ncbi:MAG TPA: hypothetical protein PKZ32_11740, partial [Candidatus Melainabacteria bacterium]|nr:hypothetical protein [Candidatus Melainabacteria bacterium]